MTVAKEPDGSKGFERNEKQKGCGEERDAERQDRTEYKSHGGAFLLVRSTTTPAYFTLRKSSYQDFHETPLVLNRLLSE